MALHKDLTGEELHEPKGVDAASLGQVYVSDGAGSGAWTDKNSDNLLFNQYFLQDRIADISTANDKCYFYVPVKSELTHVAAILHGAITTANSILSIYIDGTLFADTLTVTYSGSSAGQDHLLLIATTNEIDAGSVIEVRTDGGSDTAVSATIQIGLEAIE